MSSKTHTDDSSCGWASIGPCPHCEAARLRVALARAGAAFAEIVQTGGDDSHREYSAAGHLKACCLARVAFVPATDGSFQQAYDELAVENARLRASAPRAALALMAWDYICHLDITERALPLNEAIRRARARVPEFSAAVRGERSYRDSADGAWHPIETWESLETRPMHVLGAVMEGGAVGEMDWHGDEEGWWWAGNHPTDAHGARIYPTHWMPLPASPFKAEVSSV